MSYADSDDVLAKVALNQLSDKCAVFEPAFIPADTGSPMVVPKNRYRHWPALNQAIGVVSDEVLDHTPEEDAEFERIERNQQLSEFARVERNHEIALMANVIRSTVRTHSAEGIATRLFEAGYRFDSSAVCLK